MSISCLVLVWPLFLFLEVGGGREERERETGFEGTGTGGGEGEGDESYGTRLILFRFFDQLGVVDVA
jgi:hypothetical protein